MRYQIINDRKRALNLTNAQLAEKANVTLSTLDKITSGSNDNPKFSTLQAIARVIGCTLDDFDDQHVQSISQEAERIAKVYDTLDAHGQRVISTLVDMEAERCSASFDALNARQKEQIAEMSNAVSVTNEA